MASIPIHPSDGFDYKYNFNIDNIKDKVDAIQWTGDNIDECNKFICNSDCDDFLFSKDQSLVYEYEHGTAIKEIHPYDYIVRLAKSEYCIILSDDTFKHMFGIYDNFDIEGNSKNSPDKTSDNDIDLNIKNQYGASLRFISKEKPEISTKYGKAYIYYNYKSEYGDKLEYILFDDKEGRLLYNDQYGNHADLLLNQYDTKVNTNKKDIYDKISKSVSDSINKGSKIAENIKIMAQKSINLM